jgi:glycosyltransferase involved in cell wall biosynthesis
VDIGSIPGTPSGVELRETQGRRMKILHIATLFTPDGAFGGPTRVAINQAHALRQRGHEVIVAGAVSGYSNRPNFVDDVPALLCPAIRLVPGVGFSGIWARGLRRMLRREGQSFDAIHVHLTRDLVTLPAARWAARANVPFVVQPHGMVDPSNHPLAGPIDRWWTVPTLQTADHVLFLTDTERALLTELAGAELNFAQLGNGVPDYPISPPPSSEPIEVLFLARLHERKRPVMFARVAARLVESGLPARFTLIGPDGGERQAVDAVIRSASETVQQHLACLPAISPADVPSRIAQARMYVLPSVDEPYPMSVLEAMSVGRAVVVTSSCGLAAAVREHRCGIVTTESEDDLYSAIKTLVDNPALAVEMGEQGRKAVQTEFGMAAVAERLESLYVGAAARHDEEQPLRRHGRGTKT